jgi:hypothetical protein
MFLSKDPDLLPVNTFGTHHEQSAGAFFWFFQTSFFTKALLPLFLKPSRKNQYEQNQDNESNPAAWVVTPASAVGPGG